MSLFLVNEETCIRCGACLEVCPARIIEFRDAESFPTPVENAEEFCITCGHCTTVCPTGALTHENLAPEQCPPFRRDSMPDAEQTEHFLRARRSIRAYKEQPVSRETLEKLLEIASFAPTGHNSQSLQWLVIQDAGEVNRLGGMVVDWMRHFLQKSPAQGKAMHLDRVVTSWDKGTDRVCRSAPHLILAHAHREDRFAPFSAPIALTYLELSAPAFGLGTCWGGYFNAAAKIWSPLQEALELPEGHVTYGVLIAGYPKFAYHRLPLRNAPRVEWR